MARKELKMIDPDKYEYQSEFARSWVAHGREEGRTEGKAEGNAEGRAGLICRLLTVRFGPLTAEVETQIRSASISELDAIGERLLTVPTLQEALGQH
jgi:predicted transposase YdaD